MTLQLGVTYVNVIEIIYELGSLVYAELGGHTDGNNQRAIHSSSATY